MTFEAPWMLVGLLGMGAILWLHFRTPRDRVIPFPAVALLANVSRKRAPRLKLRRILLLVARLLAVVAVSFAMAKPGLAVKRPGGLRSGMALAQVIVVDDSLSMRQKGADGVTAFERAKAQALAELGRLRPGDAAAVVLSGFPARALVAEPMFDLEQVGAAVSGISPSYRSGDIDTALRIAARMFEESPLAEREIVLITDLAEGGWVDREISSSRDAGFGFRLVSAVEGPARKNASIDRVRVGPAGEGAAREVVVEALVTNHGDEALTGIDVIFELEGREEARGSLDVPARGQGTKRFHHRFAENGVKRGLVRIAPDDLPEDDVRHFTYNARPAVKALIVDGDYRPGSYRDEAFYLMRALETPTPREMPIAATAVDLETAAAGTIAGNDAVVLAGVDEVPPSLAARLVAFVRGGGGLLAAPGAMGGRLSSLAAIMPAEVRSVGGARKGDKPRRIGAVNRAHPIFAAFGDGPTGLEETRVYSHLLVEPDAALDRSVIADLEGGAPLLLERRSGRGSALLLTTTLDRDWTDLPIRPGFLPFVQRSVRYLSSRLGERSAPGVFVGQKVDLEVSPGMRRFLVVDPGGNEKSYATGDLVGRSKIAFDATTVPGSYRVFAELPEQGGLAELSALEFAVESDPRESALARVVVPNRIEPSAKGGSLAVEGRFPIWPYLLVAAAIFIFLEALLSGLGHRRSHARS